MTGSYAEWLNGHPDFLANIIPLVLQGLETTDLGQSATQALKEVVRENQEHLKPYAKDILTVSKVGLYILTNVQPSFVWRSHNCTIGKIKLSHKF